MLLRRCAYFAIILAVAAWVAPSALCAEPIRIGITGTSIEFAPFYAAKQGGLFKKYGFDVEIISIQGATLVVQALLGGSIDFAIVGQAFIRAAAQGADVVMISTYVNRFPFTVLVKPAIKKIEDIKGARLAISRFGSASDVALRVTLQHLGINPDKEVVFLQVGGQTDRFAALKSGAVDGTVIAPPLSGMADKLGFNVFFRMAELNIAYPHEGVVVSRNYARTRGDTISRFLKAFLESMQAMKKDRKFAVSVIARNLRLDPVKDRDELEGAYQESVLGMWEKIPYPNADGVKFILDLLKKEKNFRFKGSTDAKDYVDSKFMDQLNESGFIKALYPK